MSVTVKLARRRREAQALPLPRMVRQQRRDPRGLQKVGGGEFGTKKEGRKEGSSLQAEFMQKVLELVVHERMSLGEEVRGTKKRRK